MRNWLKIDKVTIFTGKDENGNRYLSQFLRDYKKALNPDMINAGCDRCLEDYYHKFTKYLSTMSKNKPKNSGYILRKKYENIPLEFGSRTQVNNSNLTDEMAEKLIKNHPKGKELFDNIPEKKKAPAKNLNPVKDENNGDQDKYQTDLTKLTRPELDEMAEKLGINPADFSNKGEVAAAIEDVKNATVNTGNDEEE